MGRFGIFLQSMATSLLMGRFKVYLFLRSYVLLLLLLVVVNDVIAPDPRDG